MEAFNEKLYLQLHPDVAYAVSNRSFSSGRHHYNSFGQSEGRLLRSRTDKSHGRILIAGTGRTGTTLLVQIFTALGFDTGFSVEQALANVDATSHAGLEHALNEDSPLLVKSPWLAEHFGERVIPSNLNVVFLLVPIRSLTEAAESRRRVSRIASANSAGSRDHPGGLWLTDDPANQEIVLAKQFYETTRLATRSGIRPIFIEFPKFAREADHLWEGAAPIWQAYGVTKQELEGARSQVFDASKIHL